MNTNEDTNETKEIKAEIHIEVTGKDENEEKQKKSTSIWASIALWAFIAMIASLFIGGIAVVISTVVFFFAIAMAVFYGHHGFTGGSSIYCDTPMFPDNTNDSE